MPTRTLLPALIAVLATTPPGAQELSLRGDILPMNVGASAGHTVTGTISLDESGGDTLTVATTGASLLGTSAN